MPRLSYHHAHCWELSWNCQRHIRILISEEWALEKSANVQWSYSNATLLFIFALSMFIFLEKNIPLPACPGRIRSFVRFFVQILRVAAEGCDTSCSRGSYSTQDSRRQQSCEEVQHLTHFHALLYFLFMVLLLLLLLQPGWNPQVLTPFLICHKFGSPLLAPSALPHQVQCELSKLELLDHQQAIWSPSTRSSTTSHSKY